MSLSVATVSVLAALTLFMVVSLFSATGTSPQAEPATTAQAAMLNV